MCGWRAFSCPFLGHDLQTDAFSCAKPISTNTLERHQAYIDVTGADPADLLPTLLGCSVEDLFQDLPPNLSDVSAAWSKTKGDLRAFAIQLMNENPEARAKLLQEPAKLELLGIDISPRRYPGIQTLSNLRSESSSEE
jgi:hypothetical protein